MKLAANISLLYGGVSLSEQLARAAADGFRYVEILAPYDTAPEQLARKLTKHGLALVLINTPPTPPETPMGLAAHPDKTRAFREGMEQAAAVCQATGCRRVHVMTGRRLADYTYSQQIDTLHHNLRWAHTKYPKLGLNLEALNRLDVPGYLYHDPKQVAAVIDALPDLPVGMQYDFYHVAKEGLSIIDTLSRYYPQVVHVQVAGAPDRHEPDLSRDGVLKGFEWLHQAGYQGYTGLEYRPRTGVAADGLGWFAPLLEQGWAKQ